MFAIVGFCMTTVVYVLWTEATGKPAESGVTMAFITIATTLGSYVFGATWDDKDKK